jgi:aldehyde:ferredoxin oxidoreductase
LGQLLDPLKEEGQVETSRALQIANAAADSTGMCFMAYVGFHTPEANEAFLKVTNAKLGSQHALEDLPSLGIRVLRAEREFNRKAGFTHQDDRLPRFFYEEPLPPHNTVFTISDEAVDRTFDF